MQTTFQKMKLRKQPIGPYNPRNFDLEAGDRVYERHDALVQIYDLRESTGRNKRDNGELTPCLVKKHGFPRLALMGDDGIWYWDE